MRTFTLLAALLIIGTQTIAGQAPSQAAPPPATAAPQKEALPTPPSDFAYQPDGRRDPFVNLVNRGTDARGSAPVGARPEGAAGVAVEEVVVRGILQSRSGWIAMIAAPTGRTFTIKPGDRLLDGSVRTINAQSVVLMQEVNDPLSLEKQREVRKFLRGEVK
jgi:Tfp pilus assembly protein PilP